MRRALWTPPEVAEYLNVSPATLHYWRNAAPPKGPAFIKLGEGSKTAVRYRPEVVEAWLEANTTETAA
jgi:hypothetical protein